MAGRNIVCLWEGHIYDIWINVIDLNNAFSFIHVSFTDFEKKVKKETSPALEQFLCHVAKTGQAMWVVTAKAHTLKRSQVFCIFVKNVFQDFKIILLCFTYRFAFPILSSRIPWSQFKTYFMFKLEKIMDDFQASTPEQRGLHNPNVEYVPFEEMKKRILKIVDGYNG